MESNDMIEIKCVENERELEQILDLQQKNLRKNISEKELQEQGFVTCEHDIDLIRKMNEPYHHVIAKDTKKVVGYCLVMLPERRNDIEILKPMFDLIDQRMYKDQPLQSTEYFVMGQVCVDKQYRGQNIFYDMYDHLQKSMNPYYDLVITEISNWNKRSFRAHEKQGFELIHSYLSPDGHPWDIVLWDWTN